MMVAQTTSKQAKPTFNTIEAERRNFAVRPKLSLVEWTRQHIRIVDGPLVDGGPAIPWSPETFPLQVAPMESLTDRRWSRTILCTAPQAFGKTQCVAIPPLLYAVEYLGVTPVYMAANRDLAAAQWEKKIEPAMRADPDLALLLHDNPDHGGTKTLRHFTNGTSLHMVGSESVGKISGYTSPVIVPDDMQAYPTNLPRFGHPADYILTRSGALPAEQCIHALAGTASTIDDYVWRSLNGSTFFLPFVPCSDCNTYQLIEFDRMVYDEKDPHAAIEDTWMRCAHVGCGHQIRYEELPGMLANHLWASMPPEAKWITEPVEGGVTIDPATAAICPETDRNTNIAGFWCNAFYWPHGKTWGDHAADWLSRRGDPEKEMDFRQNIEVVAYAEPEVDEERLTIEEMKEHVSDEGYEAGTVPADADCVTVTVDVQSGYVYYLVRAWRQADGTSWLIDLGTFGRPLRGRSERSVKARRTAGITRGLDSIEAMMQKGWPHGDKGRTIKPIAAAVDIGFERDIVASWWKAKHRNVWKMIQGQKAGKTGSLWPAKPSTDKRGWPYRTVDVNQAKHLLRRLLRVVKDQPGYWHMPSGGLHVNTLRAYFRHLTSEVFDRTLAIPRWVAYRPGAANHFLDTEVYQLCISRALGVRLPSMEQPKKVPAKEYARRAGTSGGWAIGR